MNIEIEIEIRNVFGLYKAYPINLAARALSAIANTKTVLRHSIDVAVNQLGFSVKVVAAPLGVTWENCE